MNRFTFICDQDGVENTMTFECETWDDAVLNFELFLRGAGYVFNEHATLQMVEPEAKTPEAKSMHYYSFERNR
jgi:hypothetical protein